MNRTSLDLSSWKEFIKGFPKDDFVLLALTADNAFTASRLHAVEAITRTLEEKLDADITSLTNVNDMVGDGDAFIVEKFLPNIPDDPKKLDEVKERALANPLYRKSLVSLDGKTVAVAVYPREALDTRESQDRFLAVLDDAVAPFKKEGFQVAVAGHPITTLYLFRYMREDLARFIPLAFLLVLITVWFVFKNVRLLFLAGAGIGVTVAATFGFAGFLNIGINNGTVAAVPVVMCLALSDLVHLFSHLDSRCVPPSGDRRAALRSALAPLLFPCFLTSLNTATGFGSLIFNHVPAIRLWHYI